MEVLSKFIEKAVEGGLFRGCRVEGRGGGGIISHLFFADDTLIFCDDSMEDLSCLREVLICFEAVSGLKINIHKSEIFAIGNISEVERKAEELGCGVGELPITYLGLPLGTKYKSIRAWDPVVERFDKRLAGWKARYLSKGGRLTLIKSTLSNLPIYYMSLFVMPVSVSIRLERIMRRFLWSGSGEDNKLSLVRWSIVKQPSGKGGLGIKFLNTMNKALLGKWTWRYGKDSEGIWKDIITWRYGGNTNKWCTQEVREAYGMGVWKGIFQMKEAAMGFVRFRVGDGARILLLHDKWCGEDPLK